MFGRPAGAGLRRCPWCRRAGRSRSVAVAAVGAGRRSSSRCRCRCRSSPCSLPDGCPSRSCRTRWCRCPGCGGAHGAGAVRCPALNPWSRCSRWSPKRRARAAGAATDWAIRRLPGRGRGHEEREDLHGSFSFFPPCCLPLWSRRRGDLSRGDHLHAMRCRIFAIMVPRGAAAGGRAEARRAGVSARIDTRPPAPILEGPSSQGLKQSSTSPTPVGRQAASA